MNLTLKVWRQANPTAQGKIETYDAKDIPEEASFLEMLDIVNERLVMIVIIINTIHVVHLERLNSKARFDVEVYKNGSKFKVTIWRCDDRSIGHGRSARCCFHGSHGSHKAK